MRPAPASATLGLKQELCCELWGANDRFMKVDVLGLAMLGRMRRAFDLLKIQGHPGRGSATCAMIRKADTVGVFRLKAAQMAMLPRMAPSRLCDLVIEVAIVRSGRIQAIWCIPICAVRPLRCWTGTWGVCLAQSRRLDASPATSHPIGCIVEKRGSCCIALSAPETQ